MTPEPSPPPKALYIEARPGMRVSLDGPALRITAPDRAERLFPLARLARVITLGQVDWQTEALLACARAGIPLTFADRGGALVGRLLGPSQGQETLANLFNQLVQRPDWRERYSECLAALEQQTLLAHRHALKIPRPLCASAATARPWLIGEYRRLIGAKRLSPLLEQTTLPLLTRCEKRLLEFGMDGIAPVLRHPDLNPAVDLLGPMQWHAAVYLLHELRRQRYGLRGADQRRPAPSPQRLVAALEKQGKPLDETCHALVQRLHLWLLEIH